MDVVFFTEAARQNVLDRIDSLNPLSQGLWGKMNVSQMLTHAQRPLEVALGTLDLKSGLKEKILSALFGKMVKKKFLSSEVLAKNVPTASSFVVADKRDFVVEKEKLKKLIDAFYDKGIKKEVSGNHPFFGEMSLREWEVLQYLHLDHHLKQFGA